MDLQDIEKEKDAITQAVETSRIMGDLMKYHERENKRLWCAVLALAAAFAIMAGCMVWTVVNAQKVANEAMMNALNAVAEIGVTQDETATTVMQDTGDGNGNNIYQSGENATYNESSSTAENNNE